MYWQATFQDADFQDDVRVGGAQEVSNNNVLIKQKMLQYMILKEYNQIKSLNDLKKRNKIQMNLPQN